MLKDWQFYPIAILLIGAAIAYALSFAEHPQNIDYSQGYEISGDSLQTLFASDGTSVSIAGDGSNPSAYAVLSAHVSKEIAPPSAGVFTTLSPEFEKAFAGQTIRVTVTARQGQATPVEEFDIIYVTAGAGDSPWHTFTPNDEFQTYSFTFEPDLPTGAPGNDYVGIWPDVEGKQRTLDVKSIKIDIIRPTAAE